MDKANMNHYIESWLANNAGRANNMSMQMQKITDEYLEIFIDGKVLQIAIPHNFYTTCSSDGIIANTDCVFIGTLIGSDESNSVHTGPDLMITLNEKLERLCSREFYSFTTVLDTVLDVFEMYKASTDHDGAVSEMEEEEEEEEEEDGWDSDGEGYSMALGITRCHLGANEGQLIKNGYTRSHLGANEGQLIKNGYLDELIEDANKRCDGARSSVVEVPGSENIKNGILGCCKVYSSSHNKWCVEFEMELAGILSDYSRHRHGHVYEALGFSFATPLVIEVTFHPLGNNFKSTSLEAQGVSLSEAFQRLWAMHRDLELEVPPIESKFAYRDDGQDDLDQQLAKLIDRRKTNPMYLYGLRTLLPRITKDFFSRGGRDRECDDNNIFVRFLLFTGSRLASLLKRCIVCDKELPFTVSRLCSCANELCLFSFEVVGLGAQVLQEVARMPVELIDLEISLASSAANSYRDVFEPFPPFLLEEREIRERSDVLNDRHIEDPYDFPSPSYMMRQKSPNANKKLGVLSSIIKSFPPVSEMRLCADEAGLKAKLAKSWLSSSTAQGQSQSVQKLGDENFVKEAWQLPYNVLRFIMCTNRLSLVFLSDDDDKLIKLDNSLYQFAVVQDSPEREVAYTAQNKNGVSRFGFHGSARENWYSILRNGLKCLSDTKLMSSGKSLGDGIYLADSFVYSAGFAIRYGYKDGWKNGMYNDSFYVVGICEVISSPSIKEGKEGSGVFVVPKESEGNVAVRYLLACNSSKNDLAATISDGHILSHGDHTVDLSQHHQNIRRKYASIASSE